MPISKDPTCYVCGATLASWEIRYKLDERQRVPLTRQKCFACRAPGTLPPKRQEDNK